MSGARHEGRLPDGTAWRAEVPENWDGVVIADADLTDQPAHAAIDRWCLAEGHAVVRSTREPAAWQVARTLENRRRIDELFRQRFGEPEAVVATGESLGGMVSRAIAERAPELADAALAMNGGGSGIIGLWNVKEDAGFALRTLLGGGADPAASDGLPGLLARAEDDAAGRARATLAAAFAMQPEWSDPDAPRPAADDLESAARAMRASLGFGLAPAIREHIEGLAGGVFAGNADVDYVALGGRLGRRRAIVERMYELAGLGLDDDLRRLDAADRTRPDPDAVRWAESGSWSGRLRMPLTTVYAIGDPAAVPEEEQAYRCAAERAGCSALLDEFFLDAAGHCRFTTGERAAAIRHALRRARGEAVAADPAVLQAEATAIDSAAGSAARAAAYVAYRPEPYLRPHDLAGRVSVSGGV
jgi:hypothetical protein